VCPRAGQYLLARGPVGYLIVRTIGESAKAHSVRETSVRGGQGIPIEDFAGLIKSVVGFEGSIKRVSSKHEVTPRKLLDASKIHALGWGGESVLITD